MSSPGRRIGLASAAVAVVAVAFMVWLPRPAIPLIDGDVWWHIRAGETVMASGRIPSTDTWSIVGSGMTWTSQDWLSNVLTAAMYRTGSLGPTLLSITFSLLVVASLVLLWRGIGLRSGIGWLSRLIWLTAGLTVAGPVVGDADGVVVVPAERGEEAIEGAQQRVDVDVCGRQIRAGRRVAATPRPT